MPACKHEGDEAGELGPHRGGAGGLVTPTQGEVEHRWVSHLTGPLAVWSMQETVPSPPYRYPR